MRARSRSSIHAAVALATLALGGSLAYRVGAAAQEAGVGVSVQKPQFTAAEGFAVEEVYPPDKSGSVLNITFDADGRLVLARDKGPIVRLIDADGDGRYDAEQIVTDRVTMSHGLQFDGRDLFAVGSGPDGTGLYRVSDGNGDGQGDRVDMVARNSDDMGEHGPHAVFFGPDGFLYWMLGNHTGLVASEDPLSPHRSYDEGQLLPIYLDPRGHATEIRAPGGVIFRTDSRRTGAAWELVTGGFRNAYDAAFNLEGELFTFDSDMEWDIGLPWYRPVRTLHVVPGGEYGSRTGSGVWPEYFPDSLPGMSSVGRGSPVGVIFYQGHAYPPSYRDAFILGDWSRGRILAGFQKRLGATYEERTADFVTGTPLNVTDVEVGADGNVYFARGGRQTEGGVYRVVYRGKEPASGGGISSGGSVARGTGGTAWLDQALTQPQPRSAWGRQRLTALKQRAAAAWAPELTATLTRAGEAPERRARALELLHVYGPAPDAARLAALRGDLLSASTYYLGLHRTPEARRELAQRLHDPDPFVRRRACEALVRSGITPGMPDEALRVDAVRDVLPLLSDTDRWVRYAARQVLRRIDRNRWREEALRLETYPAATEGLIALAQTFTGPSHEVRDVVRRELELLRALPGDADLIGVLRATHLAMGGDNGVNYKKVYEPIAELLLARFPATDPLLSREIARTLAHIGTPAAIPKIVSQLTSGSREQQIFYVYCLRAMTDGWEPADRTAVVSWFRKTQDERWKGGASFTGYLHVMWEDFLKILPESERRAAREAVPALSPQELTAGATTPRFRVPEGTVLSDQELLEYMEWDPMAYTGNSVRGRAVYEKALCATCHRFGELGQEAGPDLTDVAKRFQRKDLLDAILHPSKTISDQWQGAEIVTRRDQSVVGMIVSETADALVVQTPAGRASIPKRDVKSRKPATMSTMPEGLLNPLSLGEVRDLFAFLEGKAAPEKP